MMRGTNPVPGVRCTAILVGLLMWVWPCTQAQAPTPRFPSQSAQGTAEQAPKEDSPSGQDAEAELQTGIVLTRRGLFEEAIPHLSAARGQTSNEYAASFDLALCYAATGRYPRAIEILNSLSPRDRGKADVQNLLAQSFIGNSQPQEALAALQRAAALTPKDESLYVRVSDACMDHQNHALGLKVVDLGLAHLPDSSRLHYRRAIFLSTLDQFDLAKKDFDLAIAVAPESDTAYMAAAQKAALAGNLPEAIRAAREALQNGHANYILLTILGQSLIRAGAVPGQSEFIEAQEALEKAVAERPNYSLVQLAVGELYLLADRVDDAVAHLERSRQLDPGNTSVYSHLATAYRRQGKMQQAQQMLATLAQLNRAQAERIYSAPGDRKASYAGAGREVEDGPASQSRH